MVSSGGCGKADARGRHSPNVRGIASGPVMSVGPASAELFGIFGLLHLSDVPGRLRGLT
jgi:hypothetical protein